MKKKLKQHWQKESEASPEVTGDDLFVPVKQFRKRFESILKTAKGGKSVVLFSKKKPLALVRSELSGEDLQQLNESTLSKGPLKYIKATSQGERFELVGEPSAGESHRFVLQEATEEEWGEALLKELEERHRASARKHAQENREAVQARNKAAYAANSEKARARARDRYYCKRQQKLGEQDDAFAQDLALVLGRPVDVTPILASLTQNQRRELLDLLQFQRSSLESKKEG